MKTAVEELSPTRVRLSVEVPFEELKPSLDKAYREVSRQVRVPGFRPGRVPPTIIDRRVGRAAVLSQAVNDALPDFYTRAVRESDVTALGQPDVEITQLDDGKEFTFTAEVEIRPKFELPDLATLTVTVDNAVVTPDDVEEYLNSLRERFASLRAAQRPAETGDYTTIDLAASVDGKPVEDAQASGLSYEIGSGSLVDGLDDALVGKSAGDSATFSTELAGGEHAGRQADVTVTVHSVKVKDLPAFDDDFAQLASEFDTLGELRADTRRQLERMRGVQQVAQARDRALDTLLSSVDIPLPEGFVQHELEHARESVDGQLQRAGTTLADYLESTGQSEEEFESSLEEQSRRSVKAGLILDELAREEELQIDQNELSYFIAEQAQRAGVAPDLLARQLAESGQIGAAAGEVLRGKTLALLTERVRVIDEAGNEVDVKAALAAVTTDATDATDADVAAEAAETIEVADADAAAGTPTETADADAAAGTATETDARIAAATADAGAEEADTAAEAGAGEDA